MRHFHLKKNPLFHPVINIDRLWTLVTEGTKAKYAASKDKAAVIDVTKAGFHKVSNIINLKVLGKGRLPN